MKYAGRKELIGELGNDIGHLVNVDELDPRLEVLVIILPHELGVGRAAEVRGDTLVALLDEYTPTLNAEVGLVQAELPAGERLAVPATRLLGYVELEARPVKADRLSNRFDVRGFER
jgi:hypothetical protein